MTILEHMIAQRKAEYAGFVVLGKSHDCATGGNCSHCPATLSCREACKEEGLFNVFYQKRMKSLLSDPSYSYESLLTTYPEYFI